MTRIIVAWHVYDTRHDPPLFLHEFDDEDELGRYLGGVLVDFGFLTWLAYEVRPIFQEV